MKLVCRVSTYNNRLISYSNVSLTIRRLCSHFLQNLFKPDLLAKEDIEAIAAESQQNPSKKDTFTVYTFDCLQFILNRDEVKV